MNILQIIPSLSIGGAEVLVVKLSILFKKLGHTVTVLTFTPNDNHLTQLLHTNGIKLVVVPKKIPFVSRYYSPYNVIFVADYIKKHNFDIVHAHLTPAQWCMALVRFLYRDKIPLITSEHNTYNDRRKFFFKPIDRFMYSQFDQIVNVSKLTQEALNKWLPSAEKISRVIFNGVDLSEFNEVKKQKIGDSDEKPLSVICVARFDRQKGHEILLRAFALTEGMELYLVGDGILKEDMKLLAKELGIDDRVHFLGIRKDMPQLLADADIYAQPSLWEGFGIAALEAMVVGLPMVISDVAGLKDAVGNVGLTFPSGNIELLAKALMRLAEDEELREKLAAQSKERAKLFSLEKTVAEHLELYEEMIKK